MYTCVGAAPPRTARFRLRPRVFCSLNILPGAERAHFSITMRVKLNRGPTKS